MGFREAVTVCFQDYYTFSGRARRSEYWWFVLFIFAGSLLLSRVDAMIFGADRLFGLDGLFALFTFLPQLAASWRRMHDSGRPGWYNLLPFASFAVVLLFLFIGIVEKSLFDPADAIILFYFSVLVCAIVVLIWLVLPTQSGENMFGPEPPA